MNTKLLFHLAFYFIKILQKLRIKKTKKNKKKQKKPCCMPERSYLFLPENPLRMLPKAWPGAGRLSE